MRICQKHWDMMRAEVDRLGLGDWVAPSGEIAVMQVKDQLERRQDTKANYDPLMSAFWMVAGRCLEYLGLYSLSPELDCCICFMNSKRNPDGSCRCEDPDCGGKEPGSVPDFETWLAGDESAVASCKEYMVTKGWVNA